MAGLDLELIRHALDVAQKDGYGYVSLKAHGERFTATFAPTSAPAPPANEILEKAAVTQSDPTYDVKASSVGYFALADVSVGDEIEEGTVIGAITALGLRQEIAAKKGGVLTELLVEDGEAVEFGQTIAKVTPE